MTDRDDMISIRSLQHYRYCPHRWGLIEIGRCWSENYYVAKANVLHEKAHQPQHYIQRGKKVYSSVQVWNDEIGLFGVVDCIEKANDGIHIVEYKPKKPKGSDYNEDDAIQVFAQKLCVDAVFGCDSIGELYYSDVRERVRLPFDDEQVNGHYLTLITDTVSKIRKQLEAGSIPPIRKDQYCSGCSMKDLCMPKSRRIILKDEIRKIMEIES